MKNFSFPLYEGLGTREGLHTEKGRAELQAVSLRSVSPRNGCRQVPMTVGRPREYRITLITLLLCNPSQPQAT